MLKQLTKIYTAFISTARKLGYFHLWIEYNTKFD